MTSRARIAVLVAAAGVALAAPAAASAHASLLRTTPSASVVVNAPPKELRLTYSEPVEPRFAIVSVTDPSARQVTAGPPQRSETNADQLVVPLELLAQGWYLVYWRVISADGHPVRGAFTFAVGPNPGPAPQFVIPSISETAALVPVALIVPKFDTVPLVPEITTALPAVPVMVPVNEPAWPLVTTPPPRRKTPVVPLMLPKLVIAPVPLLT